MHKIISRIVLCIKIEYFVLDQDIDQLNDNDHYQLNKGQFTTYNGFDNTYIVI